MALHGGRQEGIDGAGARHARLAKAALVGAGVLAGGVLARAAYRRVTQ